MVWVIYHRLSTWWAVSRIANSLWSWTGSGSDVSLTKSAVLIISSPGGAFSSSDEELSTAVHLVEEFCLSTSSSLRDDGELILKGFALFLLTSGFSLLHSEPDLFLSIASSFLQSMLSLFLSRCVRIISVGFFHCDRFADIIIPQQKAETQENNGSS